MNDFLTFQKANFFKQVAKNNRMSCWHGRKNLRLQTFLSGHSATGIYAGGSDRC